jgi:predicted O-methyltransferase YrrM
MLNEIFRLSDYLQYLLTAKSRHGVHSPFVYNFADQILYGKKQSPYFEAIEVARRKMLKSDVSIDFKDFGGGNKSGSRQLQELVQNTARDAKYGRFLYRLLLAARPEYALELGTGTGITALYQGAALSPETPIHTIDGSAALCDIAAYNASQCELDNNIVFHTGTFEKVLPQLLDSMPRIDYAYIDGNHRFDPTMQYFDTLLPKLHENSILVFDDINWSEEMKRAWLHIKNHEAVTITIDIFAFGIVFFKPGREKEHFTLRY